MFDESNRIPICRTISYFFAAIAIVAVLMNNYHTPIYYAASAMLVPALFSISVLSESKGWSIFWMILAVLWFILALVQLFC